MRTRDIKTVLNTMRLDRCKNDLTDLRVILNMMSEQTSFNYQMAVKHAELFFQQGKHDELGLLLMTISKEIPGYDSNLVKNAQFLLNKIGEELKLSASNDELHTNICGLNDNQNLSGDAAL